MTAGSHTSRGDVIRLIWTGVLAAVSGAIFTGIVAHALGLSVPIAAGVGGTVMAVLVVLIIAREPSRAA